MSHPITDVSQQPKVYRTHAENVDWFDALPRLDKEVLQVDIIRRSWVFEHHLMGARVNIWDPGFSTHPWLFQMMLELLDRSKPSLGIRYFSEQVSNYI